MNSRPFDAFVVLLVMLAAVGALVVLSVVLANWMRGPLAPRKRVEGIRVQFRTLDIYILVLQAAVINGLFFSRVQLTSRNTLAVLLMVLLAIVVLGLVWRWAVEDLSNRGNVSMMQRVIWLGIGAPLLIFAPIWTALCLMVLIVSGLRPTSSAFVPTLVGVAVCVAVRWYSRRLPPPLPPKPMSAETTPAAVSDSTPAKP